MQMKYEVMLTFTGKNYLSGDDDEMVSLWKFDTLDVEEYDEIERHYLKKAQDPFISPTLSVSTAPMDPRYHTIKLDFDPDLFLQSRRKRSPPALAADCLGPGIACGPTRTA